MRIFAYVLALVAAQSLGASTYYVATSGSDSADGSLATPFLTLGKAKGVAVAGDTVLVRGGTYLLSTTLSLVSTNSGVTYKNYTGETPILYGGVRITNFASWQTNIMVTDVSTQGLAAVHFRELWCDGVWQRLARWPNDNGIGTNSYLFVATGGSSSQFTYNAGDIHTYSIPTEVQVDIFAGPNYGNDIIDVSSIDTGSRIIHLASSTQWPIGSLNRYFLQNALEELDAPGEWYLDSTNKYLYFYPSNTITGSTEIYVPVVSNLIDIGTGTTNVTFQGFEVSYCDRNGIVVSNATNCTIAGNTIINLGNFSGNGVYISGGSNNIAVGNFISYVGVNGVWIRGGTILTLTTSNNRAVSNYIHDIGMLNKASAGVFMQGVGNRAEKNLIYNSPRWGVICGNGAMFYVQSNHIYNCMKETDDGGPIYFWTGGEWLSCRESVVSMNYLHDTASYGFHTDVYLTNGVAPGVYLDDFVNGVNVFSNIIVNLSGPGIYLHATRDSWCFNNIMVDCVVDAWKTYGDLTSGSVWTAFYGGLMSGWSSATNQPAWSSVRGMDICPCIAWPDNKEMGANSIRTNIAVYQSLYANFGDYLNLTVSSNSWDYNCILVDHPPPFVVELGAVPWTTWQGYGADLHTIQANPQFRLAYPGDYCVTNTTVLSSIGFRNIQAWAIGPTNLFPQLPDPVEPPPPPPIPPVSHITLNNAIFYKP